MKLQDFKTANSIPDVAHGKTEFFMLQGKGEVDVLNTFRWEYDVSDEDLAKWCEWNCGELVVRVYHTGKQNDLNVYLSMLDGVSSANCLSGYDKRTKKNFYIYTVE